MNKWYQTASQATSQASSQSPPIQRLGLSLPSLRRRERWSSDLQSLLTSSSADLPLYSSNQDSFESSVSAWASWLRSYCFSGLIRRRSETAGLVSLPAKFPNDVELFVGPYAEQWVWKGWWPMWGSVFFLRYWPLVVFSCLAFLGLSNSTKFLG